VCDLVASTAFPLPYLQTGEKRHPILSSSTERRERKPLYHLFQSVDSLSFNSKAQFTQQTNKSLVSQLTDTES